MEQFTEISVGIGTYSPEIVRIGIVQQLQLTFGIDTLQIVRMGMWSPFQQGTKTLFFYFRFQIRKMKRLMNLKLIQEGKI
jgi:hypothetical protein